MQKEAFAAAEERFLWQGGSEAPVFPLWEALLRQSSFWGKGSPKPGAGFKTEGVVRPQWSPNRLEDIPRTGGSQLWPECWSREECRQREKGKLPEEEPTFSRAAGARPPACPPWRLKALGLELRVLMSRGSCSPSLQRSWPPTPEQILRPPPLPPVPPQAEKAT